MRLFIIAIAVIVYSCTPSTAGDVKKRFTSYAKPQKKILLELFTSQGCSSCPPADKLVSALAQADSNLFVVSFHVDYWDRLGWKDVFSNHDYTVRQQEYLQALHNKYVYTPQAVVQGQFEMTGSNQPGILHAINVATAQDDDVNLEIGISVKNRLVSVIYKLNEEPSGNYKICAVLVENQTSTSVGQGENSGRQLSGYHVARAMKSMLPAKGENSLQLILPDDIKPADALVVVFVQDIPSGKIMSVKESAL